MKIISIVIYLFLLFLFIPTLVLSGSPGTGLTSRPLSFSNNQSEVIVTENIPDTGQVLFQVDMSQWAAKGKFNPAKDSIDMPGGFNNWIGSAILQRVDTSLVYQLLLYMDSLTVQEFRFRINHDSSRTEFNSVGYHRFRVPSHPSTVRYMFNNFDTTTVPMTFSCDMYYQIKAGFFNPNPYMDFVDVADSMNTWGAYNVLFDIGHDSVYQATLNLPRSLISSQVPVKFKFRINGNWETSEFPNGHFRTYYLKDTVHGFQNLVDVYYDDQNPGIPTPPVAYNLYIQGSHYVGSTLTGTYYYEDINLHPEGVSIYKWYIEDSITQTNPTLIISDTTINYLLDTTDYGKYIVFEVTPVAAGTGDSLVGKPVRTWTGPIVSVGIGELNELKPGIYPNPVSNSMTFTNLKDIQLIEIYSILGQKVTTLVNNRSPRLTYYASELNAGIYFVRFLKQDQIISTLKFIKN